MSKKDYLSRALEWANKKSISNLKATAEGYDEPGSFVNQSTEEVIQPDISFVTSGGSKHYSVIALKEDDIQELVTKWKLLSLQASVKNGKLHLLAPKGHKMFTQRLVNKYNINALVYSI